MQYDRDMRITCKDVGAGIITIALTGVMMSGSYLVLGSECCRHPHSPHYHQAISAVKVR